MNFVKLYIAKFPIKKCCYTIVRRLSRKIGVGKGKDFLIFGDTSDFSFRALAQRLSSPLSINNTK